MIDRVIRNIYFSILSNNRSVIRQTDDQILIDHPDQILNAPDTYIIVDGVIIPTNNVTYWVEIGRV